MPQCYLLMVVNFFPTHTFLFCWILYWKRFLLPFVFDTYKTTVISQRSIDIWKLYHHFTISECIKLLPSLPVNMNKLGCNTKQIVHPLHIMLVYIDKILHLATAICESVLLHPKHHHFGYFSHFSLLVSSLTVKLLVILRYVRDFIGPSFINFPCARSLEHNFI